MAPKDVGQFMEVSKEWFHLRYVHSKALGYWRGELGAGINDMVHIWEYGMLAISTIVQTVVMVYLIAAPRG